MYSFELFDCDFIEIEIFQQNFWCVRIDTENMESGADHHGMHPIAVSSIAVCSGPHICNGKYAILFSTVTLENGSRTPELFLFFLAQCQKKREMMFKGAL